MNKLLILSVLAAAVLATGSWTKQDLTLVQNDAEFMKVEQIARDHLQIQRNGVEPKLVGVETQVVQGLNYKFTYENFDRLCHVIVWAQSWNNSYEVTKQFCDQPPHQTGFDQKEWQKNADSKKQELGAWRNIDDRGLLGTDELKTDLFNKAQAHIQATYNMNETLTKKTIETKIVAGAMYRATMESSDNTIYQVYFLSQPWVQNGAYQIVDTQVIRPEVEETSPMVGGWTAVNADLTEEFTNEVIAEAKQYIYGVTGYNGIIQYQSMSQKVVNGVVYKVDFGSMDGTQFSVEVLSQPWGAKKFEVINFNITKAGQ